MTRVFAPGKMVLTGAYAVLRGAPAIVVAVSRGAVATGEREAPASPEVAAALGAAVGPEVDLRALFDGSRKLGLGASAAGLVATLGLLARRRGERLDDPAVRRAVFDAARAAHGVAQGGGSGVDVAASVFGGVLEYSLDGADARGGGTARTSPLTLPAGVAVFAYAARTSARTTDLRHRVDALCEREPALGERVFAELTAASIAARDACRAGDGPALLTSARRFGEALAELGRAADAPIVSPADRELGQRAASAGGAFYPSGAGGGDVAVYLGPRGAEFDGHAGRLGYAPLDLTIDGGGVRELVADLPRTAMSSTETSALP